MAALNGTVGIVTCRLNLPDGSLDHACHRGFPTPLASFAYYLHLHRAFPRSRRFGRYTLSYLDPTVSHAIEACSGAFLLTPAPLFDEVGGWDEGYWFYGEDLDYCWRVSQRGYTVEYLASEEAIHDKSATSGKRRRWADLTADERSIRSRVQIEAARSHRRFFEKNLASATCRPARVAVRIALRAQLAVASRTRK
jgi:GT2 family glycosyltransferase